MQDRVTTTTSRRAPRRQRTGCDDGGPARVAEMLGDPIVEALMAADGVERRSVEGLLHVMSAKLAGPAPVASGC